MKTLLALLFVTSTAMAQDTKVTNLNDSGPGSLRSCMQAVGQRTCVFDVAGYIDLLTPIIATSGSLTVAGETAPSPGIHVRGARLEIKGDNTTLQHFAVRPGDGPGQSPSQRDGVVVWGADNVTLDHMSLTHAIDENFSTYTEVKNLKVTNCLIAEALNRSIHSENEMKAGVYVGHGMGGLVDVGGSSLWEKNLFANNMDRHLRVKQGNQIEFVNNYIFNWGRFSGSNLFNMDIGASATGNKIIFIGNVYKAGGMSINDHPCIYNGPGVPTATRIYGHSNVCPAGRMTDLANSFIVTTPPFTPQITTSMPTNDLLPYLINNVGARPYDRFAWDARLIAEVVAGVGIHKDCITACDKNPDGTIDISAGPWPVVGEDITPLPTFAPTAVVSPTVAGTIAMCTVTVPCLSLTPTVAPVLTATPIFTVTPTRTATKIPTVTPTALPQAVCEAKVAACKIKCEEARRYFAGLIPAHPFNPNASCATHWGMLVQLCEECK